MKILPYWRIGKRVIGRKNFPAYMTRWEISTPWFGIYLHKFVGPDAPIYHDHPWGFWSFVLWGGYTERVKLKQWGRESYLGYTCTHDQWWGHTYPAEPRIFHYISKLLKTPTWTLVVRGRFVRPWGFLSPRTGEWIQWNKFDESKEILD